MSQFDKDISALLLKRKIFIKHNYTSKTYGSYIYNVSVNGIEMWCINMQNMPVGSCYMWRYFSRSEHDCARKIYKVFKKEIKNLTKMNKSSGGHFIRHKTWQKWIDNYELLKSTKCLHLTKH